MTYGARGADKRDRIKSVRMTGALIEAIQREADASRSTFNDWVHRALERQVGTVRRAPEPALPGTGKAGGSPPGGSASRALARGKLDALGDDPLRGGLQSNRR